MLTIAGRIVPVPGVEVIGYRERVWAKLNVGDYTARRTTWVRQVIGHTTKGIWPQHVIPGKGPGGADKVVADFWAGDPEHSGAQIVIDTDGSIVQLVPDLSTIAAYHATYANDFSVGVEIYQLKDGGIYEATIKSWRALVRVLCRELGIPEQTPSSYKGTTIERLRNRNGGPDCVGVFGHRDQAWKYVEHLTPTQREKHPKGYASRGRGDPGDFAMLALADFEQFDYDAREDLVAWARRQHKLNAMATMRGLSLKLTTDGVAGPSTMDALAKFGFRSGRDLDAAVEMPIA